MIKKTHVFVRDIEKLYTPTHIVWNENKTKQNKAKKKQWPSVLANKLSKNKNLFKMYEKIEIFDF